MCGKKQLLACCCFLAWSGLQEFQPVHGLCETHTSQPSHACACSCLPAMHPACSRRPPFSCGVFSQAEMQAVLDWMLNTYYRHYKLYQYAFTKR